MPNKSTKYYICVMFHMSIRHKTKSVTAAHDKLCQEKLQQISGILRLLYKA